LAQVAQNTSYELPIKEVKRDVEEALNAIVNNTAPGYLKPELIQMLFDRLELPRVPEYVVTGEKELLTTMEEVDFPIVMKVIGVLHKTDVGGVVLNVESKKEAEVVYHNLMQLADAKGVLIQPMLSGMELFIGVKKEGDFGHTIVCGMGGIMIEVFKDVSMGLAPLSEVEIKDMIQGLQSYSMLKGTRGKAGIPIDLFVEIIQKVSDLVGYLPQIEELDINPLLATDKHIVAVDARIRLGERL
jgi:acetyltransferase